MGIQINEVVSSHLRVSNKTSGAIQDYSISRHKTLSVRVTRVMCVCLTAWCLQDSSSTTHTVPTPKKPQRAKVLVTLWRTAQREVGLQERTNESHHRCQPRWHWITLPL